MEKENPEPVLKKRRLSLSKSKGRFVDVDKKLLDESAEGVVPQNTSKTQHGPPKIFKLGLKVDVKGIPKPVRKIKFLMICCHLLTQI